MNKTGIEQFIIDRHTVSPNPALFECVSEDFVLMIYLHCFGGFVLLPSVFRSLP